MAVRLHPSTTNPIELCCLAGVPAETYDRLKEYKAKRPVKDGPTMAAWYEGLFRDKDMHALENFEQFGWGRLTTKAQEYKEENFPESGYAGETSDPKHAQGFIKAMGITAEGVSSVCWG